jgi:diguanylate cyclase (GGDEF)-like protein
MSISNRAVQTSTEPLDLTISLGVLMTGEWGQRPLEELLHAADTALYEAKGAGRNCLRVARPSAQTQEATKPVAQLAGKRL